VSAGFFPENERSVTNAYVNKKVNRINRYFSIKTLSRQSTYPQAALTTLYANCHTLWHKHLKRVSMPVKTTKKTKNKSYKRINNRFLFSIVSVIAVMAIGVYLLFFAHAAVNNCALVSGGKICDVNQASSPDGTDAVTSIDGEVLNLAQHGWTDWGVAFRAPTFAMNGAKPVHRFAYPDLSLHALAIEGSADYNNYVNLKNQGKARDEGIQFYAWPSAGQHDTVPIQRINRKPLWFLVLYSADPGALPYFLNNGGGTYEDGGVNFYAYPANYVPPAPAGTTVASKDTDCVNAGLRLGDKGACVQWLKGVMNTKFGTKFNTSDGTFDNTLNANILFFVKGLQNAGVKIDSYSNVVTPAIWNALGAGFPPTPAAPPTTKSNVSSSGKVILRSSGGTSATSSGGSSNAGKVDSNCPDWQTALDTQGHGVFGLPLASNCIKLYQAFAGVKVDGKWGPQTQAGLQAKKGSTASCPPGQVQRITRENNVSTADCIDAPRQPNYGSTSTVRSLASSDSKRTIHMNIWINDEKIVSVAFAKKTDWDMHIICDISVYPNVGAHGVWTYAKGNQQHGGDDGPSCTWSRNTVLGSLDFPGNAGTQSEGDRFVPLQLAREYDYPVGMKRYTGPGKY
jgi:hypothetical protein